MFIHLNMLVLTNLDHNCNKTKRIYSFLQEGTESLLRFGENQLSLSLSIE